LFRIIRSIFFEYVIVLTQYLFDRIERGFTKKYSNEFIVKKSIRYKYLKRFVVSGNI